MAISEHESFPWPKDRNVKIWRYMNFAKFVHLLLKRQLFFPRASLLGDPFEGSTPRPLFDSREFVLKNRHNDPRLESWRSMTDDQLQEMFSSLAKIAKDGANWCFVSCWHMNDHESAAMWSLYSQGSEAVAIKSTFAKLATVSPSYVNAGMVKYIDYERESYSQGNLFNALMHKRKSFEHEHEVRAIAWEILGAAIGGDEVRRNMTPEGLPIDIDLEALVECVYVHPSAPPWFREVVSEFVKRHEIVLHVRQSRLGASPLW